MLYAGQKLWSKQRQDAYKIGHYDHEANRQYQQVAEFFVGQANIGVYQADDQRDMIEPGRWGNEKYGIADSAGMQEGCPFAKASVEDKSCKKIVVVPECGNRDADAIT